MSGAIRTIGGVSFGPSALMFSSWQRLAPESQYWSPRLLHSLWKPKEMHIIDEYGLADALVARLPGGSATSTIGHLERQIPAGYLTLASGENRIVDRHLAAFYDRLRFVVSRLLWNMERLNTALGLIRYHDDEDLQRYLSTASRDR